MRLVLGLLYTVLFLCYVMTALFVVFHLLRYSLDRKSAVFTTLFFVTVFIILLFTNAVLFFSLPIEKFFPPAFL